MALLCSAGLNPRVWDAGGRVVRMGYAIRISNLARMSMGGISREEFYRLRYPLSRSLDIRSFDLA